MEINNKYNIGDTVFVYTGKYIVQATVSKITIEVNADGQEYNYYLNGRDEYAQDQLDVYYEEQDLSPNLEDILNHIEVL